MRVARSLKLGAAFATASVLGVSAASAFIGGASPSAPPSTRPVAGSDRVGDPVADPADGSSWAVRTYDSVSGANCVELGHVSGGRFGRIDRTGAFAAVPVDEGGTCGDLGVEPVILAINRYPLAGERTARTVLFGVASADVADVEVARGRGASPAHPALDGARGFVLPLEDVVAPTALPVTITLRDGRRLVYDWQE